MARKRMLAAEFFTSSTVNLLSIPAMVTFEGLWVYADDYGRGEDDVTMVKATVWPRRREVTEKKIGGHLDEIEGVGLICRYVVAAVPLLHIMSWHEHQKISHRSPTKLPPCREHEPGLWESFLRDSGGPLERFRSVSGKTPERLHDSLVKSSSDKSSLSEVGPKAARAAIRKQRSAS
jgi:hypothetical protein